MDTQEFVEDLDFALENPDFLTVAGSSLYGTSVEDSDTDHRGFTISPLGYIYNLYNKGGGLLNFETYDGNDDVDQQIHSFRKFLKYTLKGNNNFVELLFATDDTIICSNLFTQYVIDNRHKLISKQSYYPFKGFGKSEYHKIVGDVTGQLGEKRKDSIENNGYSLKNAYHSIRILKQGAELLREGVITFPRPEVGLLMEIRHGEMTLDDFKCVYEDSVIALDQAYENSPLPEKPDYNFANQLIMGSIEIAKSRA